MVLLSHRRRQLYEMAELQRSQSDQGDNPTSSEVTSLRSRASSVVSTGTKFSISTMPRGHFHIDGILEGSNPWNTTTRPASLYSVRSMAPSLPPYDGHQPMDPSLLAGTPHGHLSTIQTNNDHHVGISAGNNDPDQPLTPSDPENALSMHFGRVVRTIDDNHARQLARVYQGHEQELVRVHQSHQQELAVTRDAVDKAYRQEWKIKNREIERIREEAANEVEKVRREAAADVAALHEEIETLSATHNETFVRLQQENADSISTLHEEHQASVEKARNAIEDLWEGRWNDRTKFAADESKRAKDETQRRDLERDEEWLRVIRIKHPEFVDDMKTAMEDTRANS